MANTFFLNHWIFVSIKFKHFLLDSAETAAVDIPHKGRIYQLPLLNAMTEVVNCSWGLHFFRGTHTVYLTVACIWLFPRKNQVIFYHCSLDEHSLQMRDFTSESIISPVITETANISPILELCLLFCQVPSIETATLHTDWNINFHNTFFTFVES